MGGYIPKIAPIASPLMRRRWMSTCLSSSSGGRRDPMPNGRDHSAIFSRKSVSSVLQREKAASTTVSAVALPAPRFAAATTQSCHLYSAADAASPRGPAIASEEISSNKHAIARIAHPLADRVAGQYSGPRAECPARGISLPVLVGAARATRPVWARFFMVGRVASTARCAVPTSGKANRGASGHQRGCEMRTPFAGISLPGGRAFVGERP